MFDHLSWPSYWVLMAFALTVIATVNANHEEHDQRWLTRDFCTSKEQCHECIQTPQCVWCSALEFRSSRCFSSYRINAMILARCPEEFIQNPDNILIQLRRSELTNANSLAITDAANASSHLSEGSWLSSSSSSSSSNKTQETVQISPQELKLELRIRQAYNISFSYSRANDFPMDVYYLTNFEHPSTNFGALLAEVMRNITSDFRLGFGSTVSHFTTDENTKTYGFRNVMSLSQDIGTFVDLIRNSTILDNSDHALKGGLDAIVQVIVCRDQIGWRTDSHKVLIFSSDTEFPQDINDTLSQATRQNDGLCHLDATRVSTYSSSQGYPTIAQLNQLAKDNGIHIIWAVKNQQYNKFRTVARFVENSMARKLSNNSIAVFNSIKEQYEAITTSVEIKNTASWNINVKYFSSCLNHGPKKKTSKCNGLKIGTSVEFFAEIEATGCPANKSEWNQKFEIYPVGVNESLTVNLRMICDCNCEHEGYYSNETQYAICSGRGALKCGICKCNDEYFGRNCECGTQVSYDSNFDEPICRPDNTATVECSGRGFCLCGRCNCEMRSDENEVISGKFCECDNFSCQRHNGAICSNQGTCDCGQCKCNYGWSGSACECSTSNVACRSDGETGDTICSNHGECICGNCTCRREQGILYSGQYCNESSSMTDSP